MITPTLEQLGLFALIDVLDGMDVRTIQATTGLPIDRCQEILDIGLRIYSRHGDEWRTFWQRRRGITPNHS